MTYIYTQLSSLSDSTADLTAVLSDESTEDQGGHRHKLHKDVDGRAGSVFKRVANGVSTNSRRVLNVTLFNNLSFSAWSSELDRAFQVASFDILLRIIPRTSSVRGGESDLNS